MLFLLSSLFMLNGQGYSSPKYGNAFFSGRELHNFCISPYATDYGLCAGYVTGVADLMMEHRIYHFSACNFQVVRAEQLTQIVREFLDNNKDRLDMNARLLVAEALSQAFPCFDTPDAPQQ